MGKIDFRTVQWVHEPKLYICDEDRITVETEPNTYWRKDAKNFGAEMKLPMKESFIFTVCTEFVYNKPFDQCGLILYNGDVKKAVIGTEKKDEEYLRLVANVFHQENGDRSMRDVGSALGRMFYRIIYRAGACRVQYSFTGARYTDLREFHVDPKVGITSICMFACSPSESYFDCTFCEANVYDERMIEEA